MANITKKELIDRVAQIHQTRSVITKKVIQTFLDEVINELAKGNRLEFRDFGVFAIKTRTAREGQNPMTLEKVHVPAKRLVKFKMGRLMKQKLNAPE
jgi:integration host factor subunit beta